MLTIERPTAATSSNSLTYTIPNIFFFICAEPNERPLYRSCQRLSGTQQTLGDQLI